MARPESVATWHLDEETDEVTRLDSYTNWHEE